ncbi:MAG TPA: hypothetical protein VEG39_17440 [Clostridia bacterium]|nr:hypothetical protein [Clostridia bacterium]
MIFSYTLVSIIDIRSFTKPGNKSPLVLYIILMVISCAIGIANGYIEDMPSPAIPIKAIVEAIKGN